MGALELVASGWLLCAQRLLDDLVTYLDSMGATECSAEPDKDTIQAIKDFCDVTREFAVKPSGNNLGSLIFWQTQLMLLSLLEDHQVMSMCQQSEPQILPVFLIAWDSHCHLYRTMHDLSIVKSSLEVIGQATKRKRRV